eukprot:6491960-Amphidinium_carterae.1
MKRSGMMDKVQHLVDQQEALQPTKKGKRHQLHQPQDLRILLWNMTRCLIIPCPMLRRFWHWWLPICVQRTWQRHRSTWKFSFFLNHCEDARPFGARSIHSQRNDVPEEDPVFAGSRTKVGRPLRLEDSQRDISKVTVVSPPPWGGQLHICSDDVLRLVSVLVRAR